MNTRPSVERRNPWSSSLPQATPPLTPFFGGSNRAKPISRPGSASSPCRWGALVPRWILGPGPYLWRIVAEGTGPPSSVPRASRRSRSAGRFFLLFFRCLAQCGRCPENCEDIVCIKLLCQTIKMSRHYAKIGTFSPLVKDLFFQ